jgi:hypothetical protein
LLLACDRANQTCQGALVAKDKLIAQQDQQISLLIKQNEELRGRDSGIIDSGLLHFLLGVGAAALTVHLVKP